ncbi:hypothetical protein Y032_0357g3372 [Ancylostoma ceylanicum]|uniref:Uncharacterized protein n=1 Tax=Ancylostoma ceylanicum TaxID=53326 RepID=A0A016RW50_9BILA|nr:hypothetical protein Y032_0357g3372 [Ancylostoma ceylanicum]
MPSKNTRSKKAVDSGSHNLSTISRSVDAGSQTVESDFTDMSNEGIIRLLMERNSDPVSVRLLTILADRIPKSAMEDPELEKRSRSVVISGLDEAEGDVRFQDRQTNLENRRTALAKARLFRSSGFSDVYVRKRMTAEERKRDYELRQQARERNRGKPSSDSSAPFSYFHGYHLLITSLSLPDCYSVEDCKLPNILVPQGFSQFTCVPKF